VTTSTADVVRALRLQRPGVKRDTVACQQQFPAQQNVSERLQKV
jgi:hypothetical protein